MSIRAYIIDDEKPIRKVLRHFLDQIDGVSVVGDAEGAAEGLSGIARKSPNLVFLDIQMPGLNGIELSEVLLKLPERPLVVFATAHEEYAVEAFQVEAFDYLLKPFTLERLQKTIERAKRQLAMTAHALPQPAEKEPEAAETSEFSEESGLLLLKKGRKLIPVAVDQIVHSTLDEGVMTVATSTDAFSTNLTLNELEIRLKNRGFLRTNRNSLVNIRQILEVIPWFNRSYKLVMNDRQRTEIVVSRSHSRILKNIFSL